jgi:hypothetical protein
MTLTGYKGLPQGSVQSPLLYNLLGSGMNRFIPPGCNFLQYADDIVVYSLHHIFEIASTLVQTAGVLIAYRFLFNDRAHYFSE